MNRRQFTSSALSTAFLALTKEMVMAGSRDGNSIEAAGTFFEWHHSNRYLHGQFSAPTNGWLAVGFNQRDQLENTRFIIAAPSLEPLHFEEHIALVPQHKTVQSLGFTPMIAGVTGGYDGQTSILEFGLPIQSTDGPHLNLAPNQQISIMLAWSQETDFDHHSAWRQHFWLVL